ncbi:MAG: cyclic nucleotide-binding domain-containing protein [Bdellovibrionaceae bacterium]|nr:cyclic nucleotide-binding domain-containing protein [Pseudobdellovibrionaceae bacterium]
MNIEKIEIKFNVQPLSLIPLNRLQKDYLDVLIREKSIANLVRFYYRQGWLVHFNDLYILVFNLTNAHVILNPEFPEYFKKLVIKNDFKKFHLAQASVVKEVEFKQVHSLPFFRSLKSEVFEFLMKNSKVYEYPAYSLLIEQGTNERDMYTLLEGTAGIYKRNSQGDRFCVASLVPGCLFGEYGFFLNEPRLADVVALSKVKVLKIEYQANIFDTWINKQVAENLKHRFWIIHGIMKSNILSLLPEDTTDQLIHRGKIKEIKAGETLFEENSHGTQFYVIIQGNILIQQGQKNINVLKQGDCFGELALFVNQGIRTARAKAQVDTLLLELNAQDFFDLLADNLFLAKEIEAIAYQRVKSDQKRTKT